MLMKSQAQQNDFICRIKFLHDFITDEVLLVNDMVKHTNTKLTSSLSLYIVSPAGPP
jgi:hypothetical protein